MNNNDEKGNIVWGIIGFFFPIVGLILFLVWNKDRKGDAKKAGIGALIGVIVPRVIGAIVFIILFFLVFNTSTNFLSANYICNQFEGNYQAVSIDEQWYCKNRDTGKLYKVVEDNKLEESFQSPEEKLLNEARKQYFKDKMTNNEAEIIYGSSCEKQLDTEVKYGEYLIKFDDNGKILKYYFYDEDKSKQVKFDGDYINDSEFELDVEPYDGTINFDCE